jgi:hypothetical protein
MSNETFPTFPGRSITIKRKAHFSTKIQTANSGREIRTSWQSKPKYEFQITFEVLVAGKDGKTQPQTLMDFYIRHRGPWDTFNFVDPLDGQTRRCRFVDDALEMERMTKYHWKTSGIKIIEVFQ